MKYKKIGEICEVKGGKRLPKGEVLVDTSTEYRYLRISDFKDGYFDINNIKFITSEIHEKIKKYLIFENDVFLSIVGTIGIVSLINKDLDKVHLTENAVRINSLDKKILNNEYLAYYLKSNVGQNEIKIRTVGSTQPKLAITRIKDIPVFLPDVKIQKQIVYILKCLDLKIHNNRLAIDNLEQLCQTIFKRWFIDFEFPNEEGFPYKSSGGKMVDSELGEIPAEWMLGTIGDLGSVIGGGTPSKKEESYYTENGISWITPKDLSNNKSKFIYRGAIDITELGLAKGSAKLMSEGSVLFSSRAPIGYIAFAGKEVSTNQGFKSIVPNKGYSNYYIYFVLHHMLPIIESNAGGSTFKEISGQGLKSIGIVLPPVKLVKEYSNLVRALFEQIKTTEIENDKLLNIRDALLPKLLSGEVEIPDESVVE